MKYKFRVCELKSEKGIWSLFDKKTGHEFFRGKFNGGEKWQIFGYIGCFATLYDFLKHDCKLSGQELLQEFVKLSSVVTRPCPAVSMKFHGEKDGKKIDIDLV